MPIDDVLKESDDFLKRTGRTPGAEPAGKEATEPEEHPEGMITRGLETANRWGNEFDRGFAKAAASVPTSIGKLAAWSFPGLGDLAERTIPKNAPIRRMKEFAEEPSASGVETAGNVVGNVASFAAAPEFGAEKLTTGMLSKVLPQTKRVVIPGSHVAVRMPAWGATASKLGGATIGGAVKGGVSGAISDPEDPETGAELGAAAGAIPTPVGAALRTPAVQKMVGHSLPHLAAAGMIHSAFANPLMMAFAIPNVRWIRNPIGRTLYRFGEWITDKSGAIIGHAPAGSAGAGASRANEQMGNPL